MKQTAVQWLLGNLNTEPYSEADFKYNAKCWDKAKAMEKEQMHKCASFWRGKENEIEKPIFEKYYKETFAEIDLDIAIMVLEDFQEWRLGNVEEFLQTPKILTESIDTIINYFKSE
jgi:hypothetical protein